MPTVYLDPKVWGPHYWFFLHTLAMTYPHHPNSVTKKKYYEFIQNLPLFLPVEEISGACDFLFELAGLWFLKRSFGPIWRVVQVRQRPVPKPKTKGYPVEFQFADEPEPEGEDDDPTDYLD